mgnify:CR=1 FL=1
MGGHPRSYREVLYALGNQLLALRTRAALTQRALASALAAPRAVLLLALALWGVFRLGALLFGPLIAG